MGSLAKIRDTTDVSNVRFGADAIRFAAAEYDPACDCKAGQGKVSVTFVSGVRPKIGNDPVYANNVAF